MKQLEKLSYTDFASLSLGKDEQLAFSLGSFSLSKTLLNALLEEFSSELIQKSTSLDTDPHLWMPLSLNKKLYLGIMEAKGADLNVITKHFSRMQKFKECLLKNNPISSLLGGSSMGVETYWWDYGNRQSYFENCLKLIEKSTEADALKSFFSIPKDTENKAQGSKLKIENSILINCSIHSGFIKDSVLINVTADNINCERTVIINTSAQKIATKGSILYNVLENGLICLQPNQIRADNFSEENGHIKLHHQINSDLPWDQPVEGNPLSFQELHQINQKVNPDQGQKLATIMHNKIKQAVFDLQK